jgi:hypothetical protein
MRERSEIKETVCLRFLGAYQLVKGVTTQANRFKLVVYAVRGFRCFQTLKVTFCSLTLRA